jgi:hypothetical protein
MPCVDLAVRLCRNYSDGPNGCMNWTGKIDKKGYPIIQIRNAYGLIKSRRAHRVSASVWLGFDIDSQLLVCHHCDNPACINPDHLFVGTHSDNLNDAIRKGRRPRAAQRILRRPRCKLTASTVNRIRMLANIGVPQSRLAKIHNVNLHTIGKIVRRDSWKRLPDQLDALRVEDTSTANTL